MLDNYLPILIFIILAIILGIALPFINYILSPKRPDDEKLSPYECGFPGVSDARRPFDVRYYLVAILFIIFDLETAFLVPWAVVFRKIGWFGIGSMAIFLSLLVLGFFYEWKKGALEWE